MFEHSFFIKTEWIDSNDHLQRSERVSLPQNNPESFKENLKDFSSDLGAKTNVFTPYLWGQLFQTRNSK